MSRLFEIDRSNDERWNSSCKSQLCRLKRSCVHNGTPKGHRRVEHRAMTSMKKKKRKKKREGREKGKGADDCRTWRDDVIHSRDEGGRIHVSPILVSSLSFTESLVSPSPGAHILPYNDFCYLLPFSRCDQPRTHLCWDRNLIPGLRYFSTRRIKARENISVCRLSFISAFLEWYRCHWTHRRSSSLLCLEFASNWRKHKYIFL